jgi:hypothetical protein
MLRTRKALVLAIFLAAGTLYYQFFLFLPRTENARAAKGLTGYHYGGDFYPIWLAGRELARARQSPYMSETTTRIQNGLYGHSLQQPNAARLPENYQSYVYPLYTEILASPVIALPFPAARIALTFLFSLLSAVSVLFWTRAVGLSVSRKDAAILIILTLASLPLLEGLFAVQWGLLAAVLLAASVAAARNGKLALSGFLLALATTKPQIVVLAAAYLIFWAFSDWQRRKNLLIAFFITMAVLLGVCELILPAWLAGWWYALARYRGYTQAPLARDMLGNVLGTALTAALLLGAVAIAWKARREPVGSQEFSLGLAFVLAATTLTILHSDAIYDHEILLPAVLLVILSWRTILRLGPAVRLILLLASLALSRQRIAASVVSIAALVVGRAKIQESDFALQLPLRTSASFPFVLVALLGLMAAQLFRIRAEEKDMPGE